MNSSKKRMNMKMMMMNLNLSYNYSNFNGLRFTVFRWKIIFVLLFTVYCLRMIASRLRFYGLRF